MSLVVTETRIRALPPQGRSRRSHIVRLLGDGWYVCKGCPFSSRSPIEGMHHVVKNQQAAA